MVYELKDEDFLVNKLKNHQHCIILWGQLYTYVIISGQKIECQNIVLNSLFNKLFKDKKIISSGKDGGGYETWIFNNENS